jgi:alditol oxidase
VQPSYQVRQEVFENLAWDVVFEQFDDITSSAGSVSLFTDFGECIDSVWLKSRVEPEIPTPPLDTFLGALAATRSRHPLATLSGDSCTEQLGVAGAWLDRLPHFRMEATPASGEEIQSEYMLPRRHATAALQTLRDLASLIRPHLLISEIRTVGADDLWLSTAYRTETACIHFSWKPDPVAVDRILPDVEAALAPFEARPHWGKVFVATASELEARYERLPDFRRLAETLDKRGAFRNDFLDRHVFG